MGATIKTNCVIEEEARYLPLSSQVIFRPCRCFYLHSDKSLSLWIKCWIMCAICFSLEQSRHGRPWLHCLAWATVGACIHLSSNSGSIYTVTFAFNYTVCGLQWELCTKLSWPSAIALAWAPVGACMHLSSNSGSNLLSACYMPSSQMFLRVQNHTSVPGSYVCPHWTKQSNWHVIALALAPVGACIHSSSPHTSSYNANSGHSG